VLPINMTELVQDHILMMILTLEMIGVGGHDRVLVTLIKGIQVLKMIKDLLEEEKGLGPVMGTLFQVMVHRLYGCHLLEGRMPIPLTGSTLPRRDHQGSVRAQETTLSQLWVLLSHMDRPQLLNQQLKDLQLQLKL